MGLDAALEDMVRRVARSVMEPGKKFGACEKCGHESKDKPIDVEAMVRFVEMAERVARDLDLPSASAGMRHLATSMKVMTANEKAGDRPDPLAMLLKVSKLQH